MGSPPFDRKGAPTVRRTSRVVCLRKSYRVAEISREKPYGTSPAEGDGASSPETFAPPQSHGAYDRRCREPFQRELQLLRAVFGKRPKLSSSAQRGHGTSILPLQGACLDTPVHTTASPLSSPPLIEDQGLATFGRPKPGKTHCLAGILVRIGSCRGCRKHARITHAFCILSCAADARTLDGMTGGHGPDAPGTPRQTRQWRSRIQTAVLTFEAVRRGRGRGQAPKTHS